MKRNEDEFRRPQVTSSVAAPQAFDELVPLFFKTPAQL